MAAAVKKKDLPKGISWREDRQDYLGRFTYQKKAYVFYDKEWKRLKQRMDKAKVELEQGTYFKESNATLNSWFDEWLETYKKNTLKYSTIRNYNTYYNCYVRDGIGKMKLKDIQEKDIQQLYNYLCERGFATGTIKSVNALLSGAFKKAVKNRMIAVNPIKAIEIPKGKERKERYVFTREEQAAFLEDIKNSYLDKFFRVVLMTGMRNGEVLFCKLDNASTVALYEAV